MEQIEHDIVENRLISVEAMAEFYKTNPVQLNRIFKAFETTPGKFLKKVKLAHAQEMLDNGKSMEDIVDFTGYSANFLSKHLVD